MNILVTGAKGFVGKNLVCMLKNVKDGKDRSLPCPEIGDIYEYDVDSDKSDLEYYCKNADFVFNLAGVNRPQNAEEFMQGNFGFASVLLDTLKKYDNSCPVMLSSSIQATLVGRYNGEYGKSKKAGEELFFDYAEKTGAKVYVFRFPNLFGKWCRPNYNSAVATFCYNVANDLPITVNDESTELELLYIDDLVYAMKDLLCGKALKCEFDGVTPVYKADGRYCYVPVTHKVTLGEIVSLLKGFHGFEETLTVCEIPDGSFAKKLYSTYLSYLPERKIAFCPEMKRDERGSFTELVKTISGGQFSVNVTKPGVTKGEHWHNTKWEFFIVVSGKGVIEERRIGDDKVISIPVSGDKITAVYMLPGYTHNIRNLSETEDLVTLMWANERFDPARPDTYYEKVQE